MNTVIESTQKTEAFFWRSLSKECLENNGILAFTTALHNPYFNPVLAPNLSEDMLAYIPAIDNFYQKRQLPWVWIVNASDNASTIHSLFLANGLIRLCQSTVMLYDFNKELPQSFLNVTIQEATTEQRFIDWTLPLQEGFQSSEIEIRAYMKIHQKAWRHNPASFRHFVAYVNDIPVAAATLSLSSHGARIDDVATKTAYLRQGFGTAVTLYAMNEAKKLGYAWCCLDSSDEARPLYQKIGFTEVHTNEIYGRNTNT